MRVKISPSPLSRKWDKHKGINIMKIIASDYDGTLNRNHCVSKETADAVARWQSAGNLFGIVTGRGAEFSEIIKSCNVKCDFLIVHTGAIVMDSKLNEIYRSFADASTHPLLAEICRENGAIEFDTECSGDSFSQFNAVMETDEEAIHVCDIMNNKHGDKITAFANGRNINVVANGVSKAQGIYAAMRHFDVVKEDVAAIGDSYNDLPMILEFGGYTVTNAPDDIKAQASCICDGVEDLIGKLLNKT